MMQFKTAFLKFTPQKNHHENLIELQIWGLKSAIVLGCTGIPMFCFTQRSPVMLLTWYSYS